MNRVWSLLLVALTAGFASGCAMCCGPDDYAYPTYGGKWERVDPYHGRVGSVYSDPMLSADPDGNRAALSMDEPGE